MARFKLCGVLVEGPEPPWGHDVVFSRKGDDLRCPLCGALIYRLRRDIRGDTALVGDLFEPVGDSPAVVNDQPNPCPHCGCEWFGEWYDRHAVRYCAPALRT